ncbi:DUF1214 domain-containing protein [Saccharopolyspora sp. NFXS83]|uniref:DUF1214 domain-containing protein n=1 Tax=Saccharopolyspora sp. NFXS83 TaxID=2993560 RepID=UPI00224B4EBF|nr:DUF1214 domain-containing protein [Saccharopolyspora sp. NFXS83]MCX2729152.1 DUF1214 domain-containing protein [Saccharopolyspora sp. NFXS83]
MNEAARAVQVWAYPLVFAQRVRLNFTQPLDPNAKRPLNSAGAPLNAFGHQRRLSDPTLTVGVAPNVDTLYSVAWLDVRHNDFTLRFPDFGPRYASFQLALPDTSTPITISASAPGERLPVVSIAGGPDRLEVTEDEVRLRTWWRYVMVVGRILVEPEASDDALDATHRLQDAIELRRLPVSDAPPPTGDLSLARLSRQAETTEPEAFARALRQVLDDADPALVDEPLQRTLTRSRLLDNPSPPESADGLRHGLQDIRAHVRGLGRPANGWAINDTGTDFGGDHLLRAAVAHSQIFINPVAEALYPVCEVDSNRDLLDGSVHDYRLTFEAGSLPPARAFWSLTAYHAKGLLVANETGRYAIGDRTPRLTYRPDGSLTLEISAARPDTTANWLPVPAGPFRLMLRLYRPATTEWDPPPVIPKPMRKMP